MRRRFTVFLLLFLSACVTVNIYFPAAAVQRAADEIVKETWGGPNGKSEQVQPQSLLRFAPSRTVSLALTSEAFAQEADINVSNPAIRGLRESIKRRSGAIKPYLDKGNAGINQDGLLVIRSSDGLSLKERAEVQQLIEAERQCRRSREYLPRAGSTRRSLAGGSRTRKEVGKGSKRESRLLPYLRM
jgi:hypothetical protein